MKKLWKGRSPINKEMKILHILSGSYNIREIKWLNSHIAVIFLIWSIWLAFPFFGLGPYSYVPILDTGDSNLPGKLVYAVSLSEGQRGYWLPYGASGLDRLASGLGITSELDSLLFLFFPGWLAFGLVMVLQRFVAGYFTYRLLKESLNLNTIASLFAGLAYATYFPFTEYDARIAGFAMYDGLGLPGLPFILWALTRLDERPRYWSFLGSAGLGLLLGLNYFYAFSYILFAVVVFWFVFITPKRQPIFWVIVFLMCVTWLLSEIPVLWASCLNAPLSGRGEWDPYKVYNYRVYLIGACQQLKLHLLPLGFAFMGLFLTKGRDRRLIPLLLAIFLCFGWYIAYLPLLRLFSNYIGPLKGFNLDRSYQIAPFLAIVSAGIGLHLVGRKWRLLLTRNKSPFVDISFGKVLAAVAVIIILSQSLSVHWKMLNGIVKGRNFAALYNHPNLQQLAERRKSQPPFRVATILNNYLQQPNFALAYGLETVDGIINLYSRRYQDFWREVIRPLAKVNKGVLDFFDYKAKGRLLYLFSPSAGRPLQDKILSFEDHYNFELLSLANVRYIISPVPLQEGNLALTSSNVNEKQITWQQKGRPARMIGIIRGEYPGIPLYIYENLKVLPRFFLVGKVRLFDESSQVLAALAGADFNDLKSTAYLRSADAADLPLDNLGGIDQEVGLISYTPDKIILEVKSKGPSLLIATNNFSPYWRAKIDGSRTRVFPVNHTFQAVYIESGKHQVVLEYEPPYAIRFIRL